MYLFSGKWGGGVSPKPTNQGLNTGATIPLLYAQYLQISFITTISIQEEELSTQLVIKTKANVNQTFNLQYWSQWFNFF